ncbi:uncharacterized protein LOC110466225 isoform X2 [Mizuhopecten yessoensis]|uniref:Beta-1,4 N-acetylgalactosaminyltransferase 1 n=2 Tax=Mizuhopecten yessoensis TaxID=6573 RepID=A0A210PPX1_MIZYE|nr:uncharacterized protein LOC110466225 isoform X2 [Mizuhopecten yessoensis]XP_021378288.1 uncharacterized protein LOC110466225 isoform X2 [Mizuhopecten yessoensis]OWF38496.1 Beta-1,4 N-acetylgalactosaminyltransferase 1 [Mizuhopecten yessoensis]
MNTYLVASFAIGTVLALQIFFLYRYTLDQNISSCPQFAEKCPTPETLDISSVPVDVSKIPRQIFDVAMYLKRARLHARGYKTRTALKYACEHMDAILKGFKTSFEEVTRRKVDKPSSICPEYYVDKMNGYQIRNCSFSKPLEEIVTIVRLDYGSSADTKITRDTYGENIPVVVGDYGGKVKEQRNIRVKHMESTTTEGNALNILIQEVKTQYTLIVRNVTELDSNSRIERLVREIEILKVNAVGGAIRNSDNYWHLGCHQRVFRNYTLVYEEGYDESMHDCVFCDHVDGPFLMRTDKLKQVKFDGNLTPMGLYEDFFMRLNSDVALCPDALFDMDFPRRSDLTVEWEKFGRKRNLYKLKFSFGLVIHFGCNYDYPCKRRKGYIRSPCCIQELADANNEFMEMCEKVGASCQLNAGTNLGAVKMYKVIPWEADGDLNFHCNDFTKLRKAGLNLSSKGIRVGVEHISPCTPKATPAQLGAHTRHWHVDIWSRDTVESFTVRSEHRNLTKILHSGRIVSTMRNPALFARTMYPELFLHQQHYSEGGKITVYKFAKCPTVDSHDCIDHYYEDGNIQLNDPVA